MYLVEPTEENSRIAEEKILAFDYPDGTLTFRHGSRILENQMFDKLECISQGRIVDNKRLGAVLKLAQDELEAAGKRKRSQSMPKRRPQIQAQLRAINPVLAEPSLIKSSQKK